MDLVSPTLRTDFREFCVNHFVLRQIHDIFTMAGVKQGVLNTDRPITGQWCMLVEEYYASVDWSAGQDTDKFARDRLHNGAVVSDSADKDLREICEREGFVVDGIDIYRKPDGTKISETAVKPSDLTRLREDLLTISRLEPQQRGFAFEKFLNELFVLFGLAPRSVSGLLVNRSMVASK